MLDRPSNTRSDRNPDATPNSSPSADHRPVSGADARADACTDAPTRSTGRTHPGVITARVKDATKGRARDAARARGLSLSAFVREAIRDALNAYKKSPDAV